MARRLRFNGTGSGYNGCPSVHEDVDSGEVIVHGAPLADPADVGQLQHLSEGEVAVVVPRELLVDWSPKEKSRQVETIGLDEFADLFAKFEHTAWRLETRQRYASDETGQRWKQFIEEGSLDPEMDVPEARRWRDTIRSQVAAGKRVERVRLMDRPATTGQRYLFEMAPWNMGLGEDIRNLWRADADRLRLPAEDFWLFDSRLIAFLRFDDDDQLTHVDLVTEPAEVVRCSRVRDAAWHHAVPRERFAAEMHDDA
ncbi:DUF6879 family protein [Streptomyces sp. NPDC048182]|uniref:DUF6879 family protein n=1 Tax=Streptomyces sp. NPDC048182 TaxID=3365507 RepID=UPI003710FFB3